MSGNVNFIGTQEEWDALVEKNKLRLKAMKKQTALDWLLEEWPILESQIPPRIIAQAKAMEKEQIMDAYYIGADEESDRHGAMYQTKLDALHYYISTYGQ